MVRKQQKKSRQSRIGLDFGRAATISGIGRNDDGSLTFFGPDGAPMSVPAGFVGLEYQRPKGPKVTFQVPDCGPAVASLASALSRYNHIIGVDTNVVMHGGERLCVTAVCELKNVTYEGARWSGRVDVLWALEFYAPTKPPERIGWRHALARGISRNWLGPGASLLLVVDAYLDELHDMNGRKVPMIDDFLLPRGVSIAYASADSSDSPLNGLIQRCDSFARQVVKHVTSASDLAALEISNSTPFRAYRYWTAQSPPSAPR